MTIVAQAIIDDVSIVLNDLSATRWPVAELLGWLNAGQVEIATLVPNSNGKTVNLQLVQGIKQSAPTDNVRIIEFTRNRGVAGTTDGAAIRQVERKIMDRYVPGWGTTTASTTVVHCMYDSEDNNSVFYVYPPQTATPQYIEIIYAQIPATIAAAGNNITIVDFYRNALVDYMLYRALSKDSEYADQQAVSQAHYQSFLQAIGLKGKADLNANNDPVKQ